MATSALPPQQWRAALANALAAVPGVRAALVATYSHNDLQSAEIETSPAGDGGVKRLLDTLRATPDDTLRATPDDTPRATPDALTARREGLAITMRSQAGAALGAIALCLERAGGEEEQMLADISALAAHTIETALALAASFAARGAHLPELSPREREIADLVCVGLSDLNIAARLAISEATVGTHLTKVYRKLGIHSRVELARKLGGL